MLLVVLVTRCLFAGESVPSGLRAHDWGETTIETRHDGTFILRLDIRAWPTNGVIRVHGVTNAPERVVAHDVSGRTLRWLQSDVWVQVMAPDPASPPPVVDLVFSRDPGLIQLNALPNEKNQLEFDGPISFPVGAPALRLLAWVRQPGRYRVEVDLGLPPNKTVPVRLRIAGRDVELSHGPAGPPAATVDLSASGLLFVELEHSQAEAQALEIRSLRLSPAPARKAP
jgi:hypothetical protein